MVLLDHGEWHKRRPLGRLVRITITAEAFDAVAATLPLGSVGYEAELKAKGERLRSGSRPSAALRGEEPELAGIAQHLRDQGKMVWREWTEPTKEWPRGGFLSSKLKP